MCPSVSEHVLKHAVFLSGGLTQVWKFEASFCLVFSFFFLSASLCPSLPRCFFSSFLVSFSPLLSISLLVRLYVCLAVGGVVQRKLPWDTVEGRGHSNIGIDTSSVIEQFKPPRKMSPVILRAETVNQILTASSKHIIRNQQRKRGCGFTKDFCF